MNKDEWSTNWRHQGVIGGGGIVFTFHCDRMVRSKISVLDGVNPIVFSHSHLILGSKA